MMKTWELHKVEYFYWQDALAIVIYEDRRTEIWWDDVKIMKKDYPICNSITQIKDILASDLQTRLDVIIVALKQALS